MTYQGIDYGLGRTNVDVSNGIRYGVISQHSVGQAWYDEAQPNYGKPSCPKCGNEAQDFDIEKHDTNDLDPWNTGDGCTDYACPSCRYIFDSSEAFGDEPQGWNYESDGYVLVDCLDSDIMIIKSPYYTFAQFCSPCVPGAGNLDNPIEDGAKTYCLGHDWFESGTAPYPVFDVATGKQITP